MEKIKTKLRRSSDSALFHDSRGDVRIIIKILNEVIDKVNEIIEEINNQKQICNNNEPFEEVDKADITDKIVKNMFDKIMENLNNQPKEVE